MADVFISYSAQDRERVRPVVAALQARGWSVWWDRHILPGPSFEREIEQALNAARCVLVLWTEASVVSDWVRTEASEGYTRRILVPAQLDAVEVPLTFRYLQTADLTAWSGNTDEEEFAKLTAAVAERLGQSEPAMHFVHGMAPATTASPPRQRWWPVALVAGLLALVSAGLLLPRAGPAGDPRVAVLAFQPAGFPESEAFIGDGLAAEVINELSSREGVQVVSRTASFYYQGKEESLAAIAAALQVSALVEGDVFATEDGLTVDVRLVDSDSGLVRWRQNFPLVRRQLAEARFQIADGIARELTGAAGLPPQAAARNPLDSEAYEFYLRGYALLRRPQTEAVSESAQRAFARAITLDRGFSGAHAGLCETYLERYRLQREQRWFDAAQNSCETALATGETRQDWRVHLALARLQRAAGNPQQALVQLQAAEDLRPGAAEVEGERGNAYRDLGEAAAAEAHLRRAIDLDPTYWEAYGSLGSLHYMRRDYDAAVTVFSDLLGLVPEWPRGLVNLGSALYMAGDEARAAEVWRQAETLGGDVVPEGTLARSLSSLGLVRYYEGAFTEAARLHRRSTELVPADHRYWGRLAESLRGLDDTDGERAAYLRAVELAEGSLARNPQDWETLGLLALYSAFLDRPQQSAAYAQQALRVAPDNPTVHYFLAIAHTAINQDERALDHLEHSLRLGFSARMVADDRDLQVLAARHDQRFADLLAAASPEQAARAN